MNYSKGKIIGEHLVFYDSDWKKTNNKNKFQYYSVREYDNNGVISLKVNDFYKSGKLQMIGQYKDEAHKVKNGEFIYYYENGKVSAIGNFKDNKAFGEYKRYFENGNLRSLENYVDGRIHGDVYKYHDDGSLKNRSIFKDDELYKILAIYDREGNVIETEPYVNGNGYIPRYDSHMNLEKKSIYKNGVMKNFINYSDNNYYKIEFNNEGIRMNEVVYYDKNFKIIKELNLYHSGFIRQKIQFDKNKNIIKLVFAVIKNNEAFAEMSFTTFKKENDFLYYDSIVIMGAHEDGLIKSFQVSPHSDLSYTSGGISINGKKEYVVFTTTSEGLLKDFQVCKRRNNKCLKRKSKVIRIEN